MQKQSIIKVAIAKETWHFQYGSSLEDILSQLPPRDVPVVAAYVNGYMQRLDYKLITDSDLKWIDTTDQTGLRIYRHSQRLLLLAAHNNVLPQRELYIHHSLSNGTFCQSRGKNPLSDAELDTLKQEMHRLIKEETPIQRLPIFKEDAINFYKQQGNYLEAELLDASSRRIVFFYEIDTTVEAFDGLQVTNCKQLPHFDLCRFEDGFLLQAPTVGAATGIEKFSGISRIGTLFNRHDRWAENLEINKVGELNRAIARGGIRRIIEMAETMQSQNLFEVAQELINKVPENRLILIAGPSSSGKTTLSHRLGVILQINGLEPLTIAMDDYFLDRDKTPVDDRGQYDFENINAIDLGLFDEHLARLTRGEAVESPIFDFNQGRRSDKTRKIQMNPKQVLIVEGLHCLNPRIAQSVPNQNKKRIYISPLTQLNLDRYNPISSTDNRLLRRMTRDMQFRNTTPIETMRRWSSVQKGENNYIFPYQDNADYFINTALIYELAVLKPVIEPILQQITTKDKYYHEVKRLLGILDMIKPVDAAYVPPASLLREFIGGSSFSEEA